MRVVLADGTEFSCRNFRAIESGVLLTKDKKRKHVVGFVPNHQLQYVVPDDFEPVSTPASTGTESEATGSTTSGDVTTGDDLTVGPPVGSTAPADDTRVVKEGEVDESEVDESEVEDAERADDGGVGESELRRLGGLGSTYAERLQAAGYGTLADLAVADPVAVAEAASVAPGRGRRWVDAAGRAVGVAESDGEPDADAASPEGDEAGEEDGLDTPDESEADESEGEEREGEDEETGA